MKYKFKSFNIDELSTNFNENGKMNYMLDPKFIIELSNEAIKTDRVRIPTTDHSRGYWIIRTSDLIPLNPINWLK